MEIILACDAEGGVAKQGVMPWPRLAEDMKHFKAMTDGHCVVMGSTTWNDECTPCPLPNRLNVVASTKKIQGAQAVISGDLPTAIRTLDVGSMKKFVIGGADIVMQVLTAADVIHITEIHETYDCDTFVPKYFEPFGFRRTETKTLAANANYTRWEKQ